MATILVIDGIEFVIYSNDHRPMHVHVIHAEMEVIVNLVDFSIIDTNRTATAKFAKEAVEHVRPNRSKLMRAFKKVWKKRQAEQ